MVRTIKYDPNKNHLENVLHNAEVDATISSRMVKQSPEAEKQTPEDRQKKCGKPIFANKLENGVYAIVGWNSCGLFRLCERCRNRRLNHYKDETDRIMAEKEIDAIYCAIVGAAELSSFNYHRKIIGADYTRIPLGDGFTLVLTTSADMMDVEDNKFDFDGFNSESVKATLEQYVADIPESTRITGDLYDSFNKKKEVKEETDEPTVGVQSSRFISDASQEAIDNATLVGLVEVNKLCGIVDETNIQTAQDILVGVVKEQLINNGFYVQNQGYKNCNVVISKINWPVISHELQINRIEHVIEKKIYICNAESFNQLSPTMRKMVELQE